MIILKNQSRRQTQIRFQKTSLYNLLAVLDSFVSSLEEGQNLEDFWYVDFTVPKQIIVKEKRT